MPKLNLGAGLAFALLLIVSFQSVMVGEWGGLGYDAAYNASVAKNLARGLGHITSYASWHRFNPEITTGPVVLLPAAGFIRVFGNTPWAPGAATLLECLALFLALLWLISLTESEKNRREAVLLTILFMLADGFIEGWGALLGEVPGSLLICLGAICLHGSRERPRNLWGALALGLAFQCKNVTAIGGIAIVAEWGFRRQNRSTLFLVLVVGLLPTFVFEVWKLLSYGVAGYFALKREELIFFQGFGSGIFLTNGGISFGGNFRRAWDALWEHFGGAIALFPAYALIVGWPLVRLQKSWPRSLMAASAMHLGWWLAISPSIWVRHAYPALIYSYVAASAYVPRIPIRFERLLYSGLVVGFLGCMLVRNVPAYIARGTISDQFAARERTTKFLERLQASPGSVSLLGCGPAANRDLEYLLAGVGNFGDFLKGRPVSNKKRRILVSSGGLGKECDVALAHCDRALYQDPPYVALECQAR